MHSELFESTIPYTEPEAVRSGAYRRELDADTIPGDFRETSPQPANLSPSLRADLKRFEQPDRPAVPAWAHPVIARGKLHIRDQATPYCYDVTAT